MKLAPHLFKIQTTRSSGPGGQGVNTTESKVEMRLSIDEAHWLSAFQKSRLKTLFANKITSDGELVVTSQIHRSQKQNLEECLKIMENYIAQASIVPKKRHKTKPTRGSKERRLESKKKHSAHKQNRRARWD